MGRWLCNECASPDIRVFNEREGKEMQCYCYDCKDEQYMVSLWWWLKVRGIDNG